LASGAPPHRCDLRLQECLGDDPNEPRCYDTPQGCVVCEYPDGTTTRDCPTDPTQCWEDANGCVVCVGPDGQRERDCPTDPTQCWEDANGCTACMDASGQIDRDCPSDPTDPNEPTCETL